MSDKDNAATIRTLYQAVNDKDLDRIISLAEDDAQMEDVPFELTSRFRESWEGWLTAFPDTKIDVMNLVSSGDSVVAEIHTRGTHSGPLETPDGTVQPTHRKLEGRFCEVFDFREGKIARGRSYFDWAGLRRDLGLQAPARGSEEEAAQRP